MKNPIRNIEALISGFLVAGGVSALLSAMLSSLSLGGSLIVGLIAGLIVWGIVWAVFENVEARLPRCPECQGELPSFSVTKCCHCGSVMDFSAQRASIEARKAAAEMAVAAERLARQQWYQDLAEIFGPLFRASWGFSRWAAAGGTRAFLGIPNRSYRAIVRLVGEENTVLASFFSAVISGLLYGALAAALLLGVYWLVWGNTGPSARFTRPSPSEAVGDDEANAGETFRKAFRPPPPVPSQGNKAMDEATSASDPEQQENQSRVLAKALDDGDFNRARAAADALKKTGAFSSNTILLLTGAVEKGPPVARITALKVLGAMGPDSKDAMPTIDWALGDMDDDVRKAAVEAYNKIKGG